MVPGGDHFASTKSTALKQSRHLWTRRSANVQFGTFTLNFLPPTPLTHAIENFVTEQCAWLRTECECHEHWQGFCFTEPYSWMSLGTIDDKRLETMSRLRCDMVSDQSESLDPVRDRKFEGCIEFSRGG